MLHVYKASAGSGKTFQLVLEYLKLILKNEYNYKHILAVTFTNKATNEMKSRILEQLHKLAKNQDSTYLAELQATSGYSEQYIREKAGKVLKNILHDYNRFSISTIDSFTQKVIKSFNRELGISPNFTLDIDNDLILQEAIDRMFAKIGSDNKLLNWLRDYSRERIEENRSQRLENEISKLGHELFKESFQEFFPDDGNSVYTRENLNELVDDLQKIIQYFKNTLKNSAQEALDLISSNGLEIGDFSYGLSGIGGFFQQIADGNFYDSKGSYRFKSTRILGCSNDPGKWYAKKSPKLHIISTLVESALFPKLKELYHFSESNYPRYNSALAVLKQVRTLGILIDLKEEIKELLKEKDTLPLSDSNLLLSKIIGESDSPFVYEKTGTHYYHFMLDEFQDTSGLQWKNFKPLVLNSLAEGHSNLVVGDVKQSIYRWRNSDWNILAQQLDLDFSPAQKTEHSLNYNWRSDQNIIDFNNGIFTELIAVFEAQLFSEIEKKEEYIAKFRRIYDAYIQTSGKAEAAKKGLITIDFINHETFKEESALKLVEQVKYLQDKGIKASEIAILIRKNKEGSDIIEAFLEAAQNPDNKKYELSVLSNEALFLHASRGVLFIINTIEYLVDPENKLVKANLLYLWQSWLIPELESSKTREKFVDSTTFSENPDKAFELQLQPKMEKVKAKVLLASLDEAITYIASLFNLYQLASEIPFIQTLTDKAGELKAALSNDLSNFLYWWKEKGISTSVSVNEEVESIRLLSIHKSKGLEYKAVLLPYFNWDTTWYGFNTPLLWCQHPDAPFNRFPRLPVLADNTMKESEFAEDYYQEKVNNFIDTMNLVYVAFTRAKSVLMINCPSPKQKQNGEESGKGTDKLLLDAIRNLAQKTTFSKAFDEEKLSFRYGIQEVEKTGETKSETQYLEQYTFNDFSERIQLRFSGEDFLVEGKRQYSERNKGKIIHEILSSVETTRDLPAACHKAFMSGKINREEKQEIEESIRKNLELERTKNWFNGSFKTLNERDLLTSSGLLRPDRIMYRNTHAIVVDYKTGELMPEKYKRQVEEYARQLQESGFTKVEAYLWYLAENEIIKVCEY